MMDAKNMFSDGQSITASAASETVLDFGVANANPRRARLFNIAHKLIGLFPVELPIG